MVDSTADLNGALNHCPACLRTLSIESLFSMGDTPCPHCGRLLWFVRKTSGSAVVVTLLPGLIASSEAALRVDEIMDAVGESKLLVLNLSHMRLITSMLLAMLVVVYRRLLAAGGKLKLCGLRDGNFESFEITKLDQLFEIFDDEEKALGIP